MTTKESNDGSERFFVFARPTLTLPFRIHSPIRKPPIYESISSEESIDKNVLTKHNAPDNQNFEDQKAKRQMTYSHLLKQPIMGMSQWWTYKASDDDSEE
uniref:Ovule protein n=1 Tax=Rhabditophanes sp. KR3021 TaxID=114890 RepID=A0AC35U4D8_9BILA